MKTLAGTTVVVTRSIAQAGPLIDELEAAGASVVFAPLIEIRPIPEASASLRTAVAGLVGVDWLAVLSTNGARAVLDAIDGVPSCNLAVVGPATAAEFRQAGWEPDLVPQAATAAALAAEFPEAPLGGRVVIAQAAQGRPTLDDALGEAGWSVSTISVYDNLPVDLSPDLVVRAATGDLVIFGSPSAVDRHVASMGSNPRTAVCIGPVTANAASAAGFVVHVAHRPTTSALVSAALAASRQPGNRSES
ncbi:MAG: uroporphyrinogen-III synthase [Acidimicrobiales bacterium]